MEIYSMNGDGSDVRRLTNRPGPDGGPWFSPDGKQIVFRGRPISDAKELADYQGLLKEGLWRPTTLEIFVMNRDGSNLRQVTKLGGANFAPAWHPDGKRIIFASNIKDPKGRDFDLFMINLDGSGLEQITFNSTFDGFPMFSPDGKKLVFGSNRNAKVRRRDERVRCGLDGINLDRSKESRRSGLLKKFLLSLLASPVFKLLHPEQFHFKDQLRIRRNHAAGAARAVAERRRDGQLPFPAHFHPGDPLVPSFNDLSGAERELERLIPILGRVEFLAVCQPSGVMNLRFLSALRASAPVPASMSSYFSPEAVVIGLPSVASPEELMLYSSGCIGVRKPYLASNRTEEASEPLS